MADIEKVISDIEQQIRWIEEIECHKFPGWLNVTNAMRDAIDLLKELDAAYQGAEELLQQKTILFDDAIKRLKEQEEQINTQRKNLMILLNGPRIVRCKDCKYYDGFSQSCAEFDGIFLPDWYCADGVAKDINVPDKIRSVKLE